jgi:2-phosphosulfolactate phosphatase
MRGKTVVLTTTNGTKAIKQSKELGAAQIVVGSFLNLDVLCKWLMHQPNDIILLCAGWKDKVNLEDTLFAGAVIAQLKNNITLHCDSGLMAEQLYISMKDSLEVDVRKSSHAQRFKALHAAEDDVQFCLQLNSAPVLPIMQGEYFVSLQTQTA